MEIAKIVIHYKFNKGGKIMRCKKTKLQTEGNKVPRKLKKVTKKAIKDINKTYPYK